MPKKTSQKPDRPVGAVVFSDSGSVRTEFEHLPREQKPLELVVGRKFVGAMSHFGHGKLADLQMAEDPADLICANACGLPVGIQVTEMVDAAGAKLDALRDDFLQALKERCADTLTMFSGCALEFVDEGTEGSLLPLNRPEGRAVLDKLAAHVAALAQEIDTLGVGKRRLRKTVIEASGKKIFVTVHRRLRAASETGYAIHWGRVRVFASEDPDALFSETILKKITKSYAAPRNEFWLLVYSTSMPLAADSVSIKRAAEMLDQNPHPFDKVWYFFPYHNKDLGHVVLVWQRS